VKLHSSVPSGVNTITGYGDGYVMVNGERRSSSVVVLPDRIEQWQAAGFDRAATRTMNPREVHRSPAPQRAISLE